MRVRLEREGPSVDAVGDRGRPTHARAVAHQRNAELRSDVDARRARQDQSFEPRVAGASEVLVFPVTPVTVADSGRCTIGDASRDA